jgi:osmoprotectant transport system permease protein
MDWGWVARNWGDVVSLTGDHIILSLVPVLIGVAIAIPLGVACVRWKQIYPVVLVISIALFAIPSVALFIFILPFTGISRLTAIIPLTLYTVSLLVRSVVDGMRSVDESVRQVALAMGYRGLHRIVSVDLPIAVPVILGGLRVVTVSNIGMVAVTSVIGIPSLGDLFVDGTQRFFVTPIVVGIVLVAGLAAVIDLLLVVTQRQLSPWARRRRTA